MAKNINIFIAGSKSLQAYRQDLILWANSKNYNYRKNGEDVLISAYSFKEVGDDQDTYNKVITEESNIVVFIIEGTIGDKTKEELIKAKESFHQKKHPKVWVFTKDAEPSALAFLEGAMGRTFSVDFDSSDDLVNEVNRRIDEYVSNMPATAATPLAEPSKQTSWLKRSALLVLAGLLCLLAGVFVGNRSAGASGGGEESPKLLVVGGGSVANFINATTDVNLADFPEGYFLHLPSISAWQMLADEAVSEQTKIKYYPVCISATEANDSNICSKTLPMSDFLNKAVVISCQIGVDPLVVYMQDSAPYLKEHPDVLYNKQITREQLKDVILSKQMNVFSTSKQSGTRDNYSKLLDIDNDILDDYLAGNFADSTHHTQVSVDGVAYALLGSEYLKMAEATDVVELSLNESKSMMIYFMAYKKDESGNPCPTDFYHVPAVTRQFLSKLGIKTFNDYITPEGNVKVFENHVICDVNHLTKFENKNN